jgi:outer membrane lipoprotein-sorting protein
MVKLSVLRNVALAFLSTAASPISAVELPTIDEPVIQACIDRMMPAKSLTQSITLRSFDDSGLIEESVANVYWRHDPDDRSKAVIRLTAPASRKGLAVLMIESDSVEPKMYLYVPDLKRSRRVTGKQLATSMMGTDFSYEEFSHFQNTGADVLTKRVEDQTVNDILTYVFETTPGSEDPVYSRILTFVDQARCVPLQTQFFSVNGELSKELLATIEEIKAVGDRHVPHLVTMHDRKKNTRTELHVENVEVDVNLNDGIFSPKRLGMNP